MGIMGSFYKPLHTKKVKHIATVRYPINNKKERVRFWRIGKLDTINYLDKKSNQNLLISGATGQGKSKLMRLMIETMPNPKTIFSYKENDEYLQIDGNFIAAWSVGVGLSASLSNAKGA